MSGEGPSGSGSKKRPREEGELPEDYKEQWISLPRGGQPAGKGPFIPCKPPLRSAASEGLDEGDRFDAGMFMDKQVNLRRDVGLVISLTDPKRGIPTPGEKEWEDWDVDFKAIVPKSAEQVAQDFQKIVSAFSAKKSNANRFVAVFCEDGSNLSGYAIVSYLHQVLGKPLSEAIKEFAGARDPGIFHVPYIQDLYQSFGKGEAAPSAPAAPSWGIDVSKLVPARGDFALPAMRAGPLPVLQQPAAPSVRSSDGGGESAKSEQKEPADKMPAGWTKHWSKTHNRPYYFNKATGKQSWDAPPAAAAGSSSEKSSVLKMGALHILYKHQKSRKPSSWKDTEGSSIKSRSVADARAMMDKIRDGLLEESRDTGSLLRDLFSQKARKESDCSSAHKGGDLGLFDKGKMQPAFEKATLATRPGEISAVMESDSGVHIIFRYA